MTPQSTFMIVAPLDRSRIARMRELLATLNSQPGMADPNNALVPFARFENLQFARFVVLDDQTTGDINMLYGLHRPEPPVYLAFLGDIDGSYDAFIDQLVKDAGPGLRKIFALCDGFSADADLGAWICAHELASGANYFNWVGRTVRQTHEEGRLRSALVNYLQRSPELANESPRAVHKALCRFVQQETAAGRLTLSAPAGTPFAWHIRHLLDWVTLFVVIVGGVITLPLTIIPLLIFAWRLRTLENSDKPYAPRPAPEFDARLSALEDYDVTNQFSVMGALKPGPFRAVIVALALWIIGLSARTLYTKGRLARVHTIHSARWVYLDNRTRMFFASNYDGSLDSYMEDFINKVGFGLNLIFSNGVSYPRTRWLLLGGAKDEQHFKYTLRRHQLPTEVWYNAHPRLTTTDLHRNSRIREGLEKSQLTETEAREWLTLL
jgi:hypothetical protein